MVTIERGLSGPLASGGLTAACRSGLLACQFLAEDRVEQLFTPGEQLAVAQRRGTKRGHRSRAGTGPARTWTAAGARPGTCLRDRYEHRTHRALEQGPRVQALHPYLARLRQLDRREPDVVALLGDVGEPGAARLGT